MMVNSKHPFFRFDDRVVVKKVLIRFRSQPIMPGNSSEFAGIFEPNDGVYGVYFGVGNHRLK